MKQTLIKQPVRSISFSLALLVVFFLLSGKPAHADIIVTTPTTTDTLEFTINTATLNSWKGNFRIPETTSLSRGSVELPALIRTAVLGTKTVETAPAKTYHYDPAAVHQWLASISPLFASEAAEPELVIEDGRVTEFTPPRVGQRLDTYSSTISILNALEKSEPKVDVVTTEVRPKKELADLNNLGIRELVGRGESKFNGSPKNRRTNIAVGVKKMTGIIVKPGEEFSFNKYLGPVEAEYGFVPELVIKASGTVPELGGGLCQVSSTTFRAAMDAGLPITQRRNHAYAVQYYAPQGTDATIYPGVVDLKFTNDTEGSLLIWPFFTDTNTLIFEFYGTKDDRQVVIDKPIQYDKKSDGSMKATWTRTVTKDGQAKKDVFNSVYRSPALYHKQEQFVPAKPTTETPPPPVSETTPTTTTTPAPKTN